MEEDTVKGVVCVYMVNWLVNFIHKKFDIIHMLIFTQCLCGGC